MKYVALLRGVNVGGKSLIKMADLKICLEVAGFEQVSTYIQSGNILFSSPKTDTLLLARKINKAIESVFQLSVQVVVIDGIVYKSIIKAAPKNWGEDKDWKYNLLFLIPPFDMKEVVAGIGGLKPDIETLTVGNGVLYQSLSFKLYGRTTTGKLASKPVYQQMTIRNWNTSRKLLELLGRES